MEYNKNKLITDDGNNLVSQSLQEGQKVNFDSIIITDTPLPSDRQLSAMTVDNFKNARKYSITTLKKGKNSVQPEARLDNNGLTDDYPIQAIGLLAHVGESNSTLFGITQNSEGTPAIITKQSQTPYFITYDMAITVTNPDNYTATITPAGYVDQTTFDNTTQDIYTKIDGLETKADAKIAHDKLSDKIDNIDLSPYEKVEDAKNAHDEINEKIDSYNLTVDDNKLMYAGKPVLVAQAPNAPKLTVNINADTGNLDYTITPPSIDGGASITRYQLSYKKQSDSDWQIIDVDAGSHNGTLSNLDKGTTYKLKAVAINYAGKSIESNTNDVLTANAPKGIHLSINNDYPDGIKYNISIDDNGGTNVTGYQIYYKKDSDTNWQMFPYNQNVGNVLNLSENNNYQVKVKAQNTAGISNDSNIETLNYVDNNIYGVYYDWGASGNLERTDKATGLTAGKDFDNLYPWKFKETTDSQGNVFIRIPKFYVRRTQTGSQDNGSQTWQISKVKHGDDWSLPCCFYDYANNTEVNCINVGKYNSSQYNDLNSNNKAGVGLASIHSWHTALNSNFSYPYQLFDIHILGVLQILIMIEYGTFDLSKTNFDMSNYRGITGLDYILTIDGVNVSNSPSNSYICQDCRNYNMTIFGYPYESVSIAYGNSIATNMNFISDMLYVFVPASSQGSNNNSKYFGSIGSLTSGDYPQFTWCLNTNLFYYANNTASNSYATKLCHKGDF
ncbi:fibronectin type III domain-containing protein [Apilactobacillus timberlakei]|uniref:fibronectin type III domain-containing protein n=1 Tax=Apilactobacillus timberlakei TaxID=2008380 RepID=UPI001125DAE9|nr:fibronectin type III domain-containing protein [Apilactobacillus timberlakei]TPR16633.1 fibronectin type III domain-containing protein [Apilactobacillus timberlakei]